MVQGKAGTLPKDKMAGKFVAEWTAAFTTSGLDIKELDAGPGLAALLAVKDDDEIVRLICRFEDAAGTLTLLLLLLFSATKLTRRK